ncbi:nuclear transport factor 2 family protein [Geodermatophilus marinus]|uniref:nuclear transport factor 2 family protein n=1 Tax=Geodermatophilus sp. LHW52908 TaxID=2303986 RepID=UPI000E3B6566|nr:nuclear transport factor 2 family protein [Geodermatophilus sp. LHW52908]RFU19130.1 nuclear transport factor 2 family protein [Geodermatophilus sp. LHW52908]
MHLAGGGRGRGPRRPTTAPGRGLRPGPAARLTRVEDALALHELVARYALAVDDRDWGTLRGLFTADAVFAGIAERVEGRDAVVDYLARRLAASGPTAHSPHAHVLDRGAPGEATGTVSMHAEQAIDGTAMVLAFRYSDAYRREEGRWRFRSRRLRFLYAVPAADYPTAVTDQLALRFPGAAPRPAQLGPWAGA